MSLFKILLVDDDVQALESMHKILLLGGYEVDTAQDGQEALEKVRAPESNYDLIVTDVRMPKLGGLEFLKALSLFSRTTPVLLMTAFGRIEDAVWALKLGAVDFLTKPFKKDAFLAAVKGALKRKKPRSALPEKAQLIGVSAEMARIKEWISQVAPTEATVLIEGESGVGKDVVARMIHENSARAQEPFIALNCAAIPESLIESELFGYEKGAFSGAASHKKGLLEAADRGTLFLDEIGDMPYALQARLLRAIQEREVRRLGATISHKIDVRVISATHQDLKAAVLEKKFREDLLFRLDVISIRISPLRERVEDISELAKYFSAVYSRRHHKTIEMISNEAIQALLTYPWPGNVRELSNVIERAVVFNLTGMIDVSDLPAHFSPDGNARTELRELVVTIPIGTPLREAEDLLIRKTLEAADGDKNVAAKLLGVNSRTIYRKLEKQKPPEIPENS